MPSYTAQQLCELLNATPDQVYRWLRDGILPAKRNPPTFEISAADLRKFEKPKLGRKFAKVEAK